MPLLAEPRDARYDSAPQSEHALARLWLRTKVLSTGIVTEDGERLRVVYPGRSNPRAGPDFLDAVLTTESGEILRGDVELHLRAPDWYGHGHHVDSNYNGVILHVVLYTVGRIRTELPSRMSAPIASLAPVAKELAGLRIAHAYAVDDEPPREQSDIGDRLDAAGDGRFLSKSSGFALAVESSSPEEVLYQAMMEALGYASNRRPFRELARRVPLSTLAAFRHEPAATRYLAILALLGKTSGLLEAVEEAARRTGLRRLSEKLPKTRPLSRDAWDLHRVRPTNHPAGRVVGAASIVDMYSDRGLLTGLEEDLRENGPRYVSKRLTVKPYVGTGRAGDIVVNVVLPFLHAYAGIRRDRDLGDLCLKGFRSFPRLGDNEILREMRKLLGLDPETVHNARRQQGLMQLYRSTVRGTPA
ncbi:MAG: DUF2851 family protein [Chloroflexi bacterium]|nr:DUF2851 family protein [Chloroflexota bacterium]